MWLKIVIKIVSQIFGYFRDHIKKFQSHEEKISKVEKMFAKPR